MTAKANPAAGAQMARKSIVPLLGVILIAFAVYLQATRTAKPEFLNIARSTPAAVGPEQTLGIDITAPVAGDSQSTQYIVTAQSLNVRAGPSSSTARIGGLVNGQVITVTKQEGDWCQFVFNGTPAYVHCNYISKKEP